MGSYNVLAITVGLIFCVAIVAAQTCPPADEIVYSPFEPNTEKAYFNYTGRTDNGCWWYAGCTLTQADESRKQQFASVALVMGLIPLTLKDIAWPERRIVVVSRSLSIIPDILVRALGLIPIVKEETAGQTYDASSLFALDFVRKRSAPQLNYWKGALLAGSVVGLGLSYAALAVTEIYSKRSALGCPYPIFIVTWHLVALLPAAITSLFASRAVKGEDHHSGAVMSVTEPLEDETTISSPSRSTSMPKTNGSQSSNGASTGYESRQFDPEAITTNRSLGNHDASLTRSQTKDTKQEEETSAVQGKGMSWLIQLSWAIYYIAGTLVYSSIMAVTVVELVVWVFASMFAAAMSKSVAVSICTFF